MFILLLASCFLFFISDMQVICSRHTCMLQQYFHLHQKRLDGNLTFISADPVMVCVIVCVDGFGLFQVHVVFPFAVTFD